MLRTLLSNSQFRIRCLPSFAIRLLLAALFVPTIIFSQTAMSNGGNYPSALPANGTVTFTFDANTGDNVILRAGSTGFVPRIDLFAANGTLLGTAPSGSPSSALRDSVLTNRVAAGGSFRVTITSFYANGSGSFTLHLARAPGPFSVPTGDDGGTLANGALNGATIDLGDLDLWTFSGNAGDNVQLRVGATNFVPRIDLYGPDGALVGFAPAGSPSSAQRDTALPFKLAAKGDYTVVVSSFYSGNSGGYAISLAQAPESFVVSPGDSGGVLSNGAFNTGTIDLGDLDVWTFTGHAGDSIQLRMGATNLVPRIDLYGPDGAQIAFAPTGSPSSAQRDSVINTRLTADGSYTVVVSSFYSGNQGGYSLTLAQAPGSFLVSPGDDGGALANGALASGTITLGDLDLWSFTAHAGDSIQLRMGASSFVPRIDLYGPDGALVTTDPAGNPSSALRDSSIETQLTSTGNYTVMVSSFYSGTVGTYDLSFVHIPDQIVVSPGDEGGPLTNGWTHIGTIDLGDVDLYSFAGKAGDSIQLRMGGTNFVPQIFLYGPTGALIDSEPAGSPSSALRDTVLTNRLSTDGTYTVAVNSFYPGTQGGYSLTLAQAPGGPLTISPGDEGGTMANGFVYFGTNILGDLDVWTFYGTVGDSNIFRIGTGGTLSPWLRLYSPSGDLVKEAFVNATANRTNQMVYVVTNNGTYTLVSEALFSGEQGPYNLKQSRVPPDINMPAAITINEGQTLNIPISAQDPDVPEKTLTFNLQNAPQGVVLTPLGPTNAVITWATTEATGPSTNTFLVTVTDIVNVSSFTRTNLFTVVVNEVNVAPILTAPPDTVLNELTPLSVSASATDVDLPKNPLTFSLVSAPGGMTIDPDTGVISWLPSEDQGPGSYPITVVVTDDSPSAVNERHLSDTKTFNVTVKEVNVPPQIATIGDLATDEGKLFNLQVQATDSDRPANALTYSLVNPQPGLVISQSGVISWTPTEAQGPSTNVITVMVTDDNPVAVNEQHLTATATFKLVINEVNLPPVLGSIAAQTIDELKTLTVSNVASDPDIPTNALTYALVGAPSGATISQSGVISWTPTEAQGPTNVTITTVVTDNGVPPLSVTNSFAVTVNEVNTAPTLPVINSRTINELTQLVVTNTAADEDLPANTLTYVLVGAPIGATIDASGIIRWTPSEAQGPTNVTLTTIVTDNGVPPLSATNSFAVVVNEVNSAPVLNLPASAQTVDELTPFSLLVTATDSDIPANSLTFQLLQRPDGMVITPDGQITWTPTEAQGPSTNTITIVVTDLNPAALVDPQKSQTNSFTLIVNEVNTAPSIADIPPASVHFGTALSLHPTVTDPDIPANTVTLTLENAPAGMTASNGIISWTPLEAQLGVYTVTLHATDDGNPPKSAAQTFQVTVTGSGASLAVSQLPNNLVQIDITADAGHTYELQKSSDLATWDALIQVPLGSSTYQHIEPMSTTHRFYRLKLVQ